MVGDDVVDVGRRPGSGRSRGSSPISSTNSESDMLKLFRYVTDENYRTDDRRSEQNSSRLVT